jgi:hypothetical protein
MPKQLLCYRCGASLAKLTLPISRQDECPSCANYLHVCRMCEFFDPNVPKQCKEDDAEEVFEKERLNFCDWFKPGPMMMPCSKMPKICLNRGIAAKAAPTR